MIIVGSPSADFLDRNHVVTKLDGKWVADFYTVTDIKVDRIIKKPAYSLLEVNQVQSVIEPLSITEGTGNKKGKITREHYQELKKDNQYMIFLVKNTKGNYAIMNMESGRFTLDGKDPSEPGESHEKEKKSKMKKELLVKYKDALK